MRPTGETTTKRRGIRIEPGTKRVRAYVGGEPVADTIQPVLVWEVPYYPTYYFPVSDVRTELLQREDGVGHSPSRGDGHRFSVKGRPHAALRYEESPIEELRDLIRFDWHSMDAWFEEDEQVFTHPRDPYTRVDILASSRHVRVEVGGTTIAESTSPRMLFETGLPVRYYVPKTHVRMDLLMPTGSVSHCPYKGQAEYWSLRVGDEERQDVAWSYRSPFPESQKIAGLISFYQERIDLYVDEIRQR